MSEEDYVKLDSLVVKTKLVKLSLCPCGYGLLRDTIELGTEYLVYPDTCDPEEAYTLICGGCGYKSVGVGRIYANSVHNPAAPPTPLPLEIFEISNNYVPEVQINEL